MGDPKRPKKKWIEGKPMKLWNKQLLVEELQLVGEYGLRNKRELWLAKSILIRIKRRAREMLALPAEERRKVEAPFKEKLYKMGFIPDPDVPLDYILGLDVRAILERRLQTLVYRKGLARSIHEARQLIVHRHIAINGRVVNAPGLLVPRDLEDKITYAPTSPLYKRLASGEPVFGPGQPAPLQVQLGLLKAETSAQPSSE